MLDSPLGRRVAGTSEGDLALLLLNDAYKLKMHRLYAMSYGGVVADFVLNVRRTPFPLKRIRTEARLAHAPAVLEGQSSTLSICGVRRDLPCARTPFNKRWYLEGATIS